MEWWVWALIIVATVMAYVAGRSSVPTLAAQEPKRFGLEQAEAAMTYVRTGGAVVAKSVLGVVVGVLGYKNTVAEDVAEEVNALASENARRNERAQDDELKIAALRAEIMYLRDQNAGADTHVAQLSKIAEIFRS